MGKIKSSLPVTFLPSKALASLILSVVMLVIYLILEGCFFTEGEVGVSGAESFTRHGMHVRAALHHQVKKSVTCLLL